MTIVGISQQLQFEKNLGQDITSQNNKGVGK